MSVLDDLKSELRLIHDQIENTPFALQMVNGSINATSYCESLFQLRIVHAALEECVNRNQTSKPFFEDRMRRTDALNRDLSYWNTTISDREAFPETMALVQQFQDWTKGQGRELVGALYVMEGSRMGSIFLAQPLSAALGVPATLGVGLDYHVEGRDELVPRWWSFKTIIATKCEDDPSVVTGAVATMEGLLALYLALSPCQTNETCSYAHAQLHA